uniref:Uncharacterized protein n=1 Tax=Magnetospirillum gryphiswaldense TaxID=55518 RepID=A4TVY7_9PROT|nr:hypothetical protein MGR_0023 [Magnetospirillum gryphiswaldense MSR-1]
MNSSLQRLKTASAQPCGHPWRGDFAVMGSKAWITPHHPP